MKKTIALAAIIAAAATATQAQAGLRADIHAGWDGVSIEQRTDIGTSGATTQANDDGVVYGGEIGYDLSFSHLKLGVYGGLDGASTKQCAEVFTEIETCAKAGRNWTLGVRAGVNVTPSVLLYAKGGYSNGQIKMEYIDHVTPADSFTLSEDMDGFHVGAGVQLDLMSNFYAKLEYVHTDYKDYAFTDGTATISGGVKRDNVLVGVGIRF